MCLNRDDLYEINLPFSRLALIKTHFCVYGSPCKTSCRINLLCVILVFMARDRKQTHKSVYTKNVCFKNRINTLDTFLRFFLNTCFFCEHSELISCESCMHSCQPCMSMQFIHNAARVQQA